MNPGTCPPASVTNREIRSGDTRSKSGLAICSSAGFGESSAETALELAEKPPASLPAKSKISQGDLRSSMSYSGSPGPSGDSSCVPASTSTGTRCAFAATATARCPAAQRAVPSWNTPFAPSTTKWHRGITAKVAASAITVVATPLSAKSLASLCPAPPGSPSATTHWNVLFLFASRKNASTEQLPPAVKTTHPGVTCSTACTAQCPSAVSSSSISSPTLSMTSCLNRFIRVCWSFSPPPPVTAPVSICATPPVPVPKAPLPPACSTASSRMMCSTRRHMLPTTSSKGLASTSFLETNRTPSIIPPTVNACCAATAWINSSVVCLASATLDAGNCRRLSLVVKSSSTA
mmetsp:Transcript_13483/g.50514  ORF Transcript_13483/g.50514 Transcript_13483/m.50514 type:complete len:348 (-) Transcript_13483:103-1146(-)